MKSILLSARLSLRPMLLAFAAAALFAIPSVRAAESVDLTMGNPSSAEANPATKDNYLMVKKFYALSYNNTKGRPNWVSWQLTREDVGTADRVAFFPDAELGQGFQKVTPADYTNSGFDRGHMCNHSDRSSSAEASKATFAMTNMIPQSPNVNQKAWAQLEEYCRQQVETKRLRAYIICGPEGQGGEGRNGKKDSIGAAATGNKVEVPAKCWKVIIFVPAGRGDDVKKVTATTRLVAVIMPNDMSVGEEWAGFRVSVKEVEKLTGYKFFSNVPAAIIDPLKEEIDEEPIAPPVPLRH